MNYDAQNHELEIDGFNYSCDMTAEKCSIKKLWVQLSPEEHFLGWK